MRSETESFPPDLTRLASTWKALAHPARLAILQTLGDRGTCICGEVVDVLPLAQATVSQHLRTLREAGLVRGEIEGPRTCYCLDVAALRALADEFQSFVNAVAPDPCERTASTCA